ncbi:MAG: YraN family protein [Bacteroidales bacterium]|nr:YraN family protein [Candidatus Sodaliphilus fimicaballi]
MAQHNEFGQFGEKVACELLISKGLVIRETNWRLNHLEVDIIAYDEKTSTLHIVEVKTRRTALFNPMDSINYSKQKNLINAANGYIRYYQLRCGIQYDVIFVIGSQQNYKIEYIPNAFRPRLKTYR